MNTRTFTLETVLSITTGVLLTDIGNVYDILNYMTGDNLLTHQLPLAADICKHAIWKQHPKLRYAQMWEPTDWLWFIHDKRRKYGNYFQIVPLKHWTERNFLADAVRMVGADKVIAVCVSP